MPYSLRTSFLATAYYSWLERRILPRFPEWGMSPNRLTCIGMLFSLAVPLGFWIHPVWGFFLIMLSGAADSMDGLMARHQNRTSRWGAFLDSSLDRISDFFYLVGFWVVFWRHAAPAPATLAIFFVALMTTLISYTKARAEALGVPCPVGLMERGVRVAFLMMWALLLALVPDGRNIVLWLGLTIYGILALFTVLQRGFYIMHHMADRKSMT